MSPPVSPPQNLLCEETLPLLSFLESRLGVTRERGEWLIAFGAVYHNRARVAADRPVERGDWVRVHVSPRRFPAAEVRWSERIVREEEEWIAVNKPAGIPVHPTCDNAVENLLAQMQRLRGPELRIVHRLDVATQGLMILAKTKAFGGRFGRALENRRVEKRYRVLVSREISTGELIHYMMPANRAPRVVEATAREGWKRCALTIDSVVPRKDGAFEVGVTLETGRMHQIRCQLAAAGAPVVGDGLYGSAVPVPPALGDGDVIALQSCALRFDGFEVTLPAPW